MNQKQYLMITYRPLFWKCNEKIRIKKQKKIKNQVTNKLKLIKRISKT